MGNVGGKEREHYEGKGSDDDLGGGENFHYEGEERRGGHTSVSTPLRASLRERQKGAQFIEGGQTEVGHNASTDGIALAQAQGRGIPGKEGCRKAHLPGRIDIVEQVVSHKEAFVTRDAAAREGGLRELKEGRGGFRLAVDK